MKLYEILAEIEKISEEMIDLETGEVREESLEALEELEMERDTKVENILCLSKSLRADVTALKDEAKVLIERAEKKLKKAESLEQWVAQVLQGESFETPRVAVKWRASERVNILDVDAIPKEYVHYRTEEKPDKKAIKEAIKLGAVIPGAELESKLNMKVV